MALPDFSTYIYTRHSPFPGLVRFDILIARRIKIAAHTHVPFNLKQLVPCAFWVNVGEQRQNFQLKLFYYATKLFFKLS